MTAGVDSDRREELTRTRTSVGLWFGLIGAPAAALASTVINYTAVDRACVGNNSLVLHLLTLLFLLVGLAAGLTAWWYRQRIGDWPATGAGMRPRARFMTTVGIFLAAVATFGMILQWIPIFFLGPCYGT